MIALDEILDALEQASDGITTYFDRETDRIILVTEDDLSAAERSSLDDIPDWQQETVATIRRIENDDGKRFLLLPDSHDIHVWNIMQKFSLSVADIEVSKELDRSLRGSGAFRKFKDYVREHNMEQEWYKYRDDSLRKIAVDWCKENGINYSGEKNKDELLGPPNKATSQAIAQLERGKSRRFTNVKALMKDLHAND